MIIIIYEKLGQTDLSVSKIGLGTEHFSCDDLRVNEMLDMAIDIGINFIDVFMAGPEIRTCIGKALGKKRNKVILQGHLGAVMIDNQPTQSREINLVRQYFEDFMDRMNTDYVDIGYIHFIDKEKDYKEAFEGGLVDYAIKLKEKGIIRAIGLSTHSINIALKAVYSGVVDCIMFPINPAFDYMPKDQNVFDIFNKETQNVDNWFRMEPMRQELYTYCMLEKIGVVAMKILGGGVLLNKNLSPFGESLTVNQCIHYALSKKFITSAMVGCRNINEVKELSSYYNSTDRDKDYLPVISNSKIKNIQGKCVYCNHCLPCPSNIDIAEVIRYKDIALYSHNYNTNNISKHYNALQNNASDCIKCGQCIKKCPFNVNIIYEMEMANKIFGRLIEEGI